MKEIEMYQSGMSITEVSKETGIPLSTIRFRLKKAGVLRSRGDGVRNAAKKGILGASLKGRKREFTEEWKSNISKAKSGKGVGLSKKKDGYVQITMGENKGRGLHVVIMEEKIGRKLFANECVHHIDHNKHNNNIENLALMTRSEHAALHAKENNEKRERLKNGRYK